MRTPSKLFVTAAGLALLAAGCPSEAKPGLTGSDPDASIDAGSDSGAVDIVLADPGPPDAGVASDPGPPDVGLPDSPPPDTPPDAPLVDATPSPCPSGEIVLDPTTLSFYDLPIGSIRYAVEGRDPVANACATLVWDFSNNGQTYEAHCDDFFPDFPYAIVDLNSVDGCGWDYGPNAEMVSASGCVDWQGLTPWSQNLADVEVEVVSEGVTCTVRVDNRQILDPPLTTFGLVYTSDVPEDVWVECADQWGSAPAWLTVRQGDQELRILDVVGGMCPDQLDNPGLVDVCAQNITGTDYMGSVFATWDGYFRLWDAVGECWYREPAAPGDYLAEMCFAWQVDADGLVNPMCFEEPFTYPTDEVIHSADFGG